MDLKQQLEFEEKFGKGKVQERQNGIYYFQEKEFSVRLGILELDAYDSICSLRELCRKFYLWGIESEKAKKLQTSIQRKEVSESNS